MEENVSRERRKLFRGGLILISGLCAVGAGLSLGGGIRTLGGPDLRPALCLLFAAALLFQGYSDLPGPHPYSGAYRWAVRISGVVIAFLVYDLGILIPVRIVEFCVPAARGNRTLKAVTAVTAACLSLGITAGGVIHARSVRVRPYRVPTAALDEGETYRVVQLSDLHIGSIIGKRYLSRVMERVNALRPDLIVITGDLINHGGMNECGDADGAARILAGMRARDGVYAVTGNHDPDPSDPAFGRFFSEAGIRLLRNQSAVLPHCVLLGRDGAHMTDRPPIGSFLPEHAQNRVRIVLDHYPDGLREASEAGADLFLCGHTHNGQYFPLMYMIRWKYRHGTSYGKSDCHGTTCIVSSGTGCFQIPIRIGTDSEIVCADLYGAKRRRTDGNPDDHRPPLRRTPSGDAVQPCREQRPDGDPGMASQP
ncbi:metallophosphoesterase [Chordicoccus furentiruminis]|jgi:hypothetical protein|uniref:metallophosphoesterase n=1 Tax=Chordicoccus furentiruminis TaxID=2709410 RepID=UPI0023A80D63|nr:metallophosphoesterase [Chordicoccus furentiruminis]